MAFLCRCDRCLETKSCSYLVLVTSSQQVTTCFFACVKCIRRAWLIGSLVEEMIRRDSVGHDANAGFRMALRVCEAMDLPREPVTAWWASNQWRVMFIKPYGLPAFRKSTANVVRRWLDGLFDWTYSPVCSLCGRCIAYGIYRASMQTPIAFACCRCINIMMVLASPIVQESGDVPFDYVMIDNGDEVAIVYQYGSLELLFWLIANS